jgi:uncharacterized protein
MHLIRFRTPGLLAALLLALSGCGGSETASPDSFNSREITFPNGTKIRAELAMHPQDVTRGMKYRDSLAPDRGMLFFHGREGVYRYWMFEVKIPLDMLWMDKNHKIVQIVHNAPPCPGPSEKCPNYGGAYKSAYVLELPAGTALKNNLKPGMILEF